mmetsp:Transcript_64151/g.144698  ORF Transcript_64151/g.144698 Transcript_64151/m.144698 type:complete len:133 (-) Transcript_64151:626-1024(-)
MFPRSFILLLCMVQPARSLSVRSIVPRQRFGHGAPRKLVREHFHGTMMVAARQDNPAAESPPAETGSASQSGDAGDRHPTEEEVDEDLRKAWELGQETGAEIGEDISRRFYQPKVDDVGLIIADSLMSGIVT